jgi:imidazole glycerol-phosphate synthase subunit HisH
MLDEANINNDVTVGILNYGLGNLQSIKNVIHKIGGKAEIIDDVSQLKDAQKLILPGIGAFDDGMTCLQEKSWIDALHHVVLEKKIPTLGICLGMQLMCNKSEEGKLPGLGWFDANVVKFKMPQGSTFKIPHMGWNAIDVKKSNPIIHFKNEEQRFYFVHSYHVVCNSQSDLLATANHGYEFTAAISNNNIFATQFHPEKSHRFGMELMQHFLSI